MYVRAGWRRRHFVSDGSQGSGEVVVQIMDEAVFLLFLASCSWIYFWNPGKTGHYVCGS